MNTKGIFSHKSDEWSTPTGFYEELNKEFDFTLDPCANFENHKCDKYYTLQDDGLRQNWEGQTVFVNPPYSNIKVWAKKCYEESKKDNTIIVLLMPSRTDTKYFHEYIYKKAELRFIKGRLKFGNSKNSAPFPSMLAIYNNKNEKN